MPTRIGLLGGTFDPVHNGHLSIANSFLKSGQIDQLWVLLTPDPPHKTGIKRTAFELRLEMLIAAFIGMDKARVMTIENELPRPSYTYRTISYLKRLYPEKEYYLCIGGDSLAKFHTWKEYENILAEVNLLVANRPGEPITDVHSSILKKSFLVEHHLIPDSSSEVKQRVKNGKSISAFVPTQVEKIILNKGLYI